MINKRNGTYEWMFQRLSSLVIFSFAIFYMCFVFTLDPLAYENWLAIHSALWFKLYATFTLVVVSGNSILAGWQIGTDYTQKVPVAGFSTIFHGFYMIVTVAMFAGGMLILWSLL